MKHIYKFYFPLIDSCFLKNVNDTPYTDEIYFIKLKRL